jgi:hypothetical protein
MAIISTQVMQAVRAALGFKEPQPELERVAIQCIHWDLKLAQQQPVPFVNFRVEFNDVVSVTPLSSIFFRS